MSIWKTLWCLILHWHRHTTYSNGARKCYRCGTYLRPGASPKRFNPNFRIWHHE